MGSSRLSVQPRVREWELWECFWYHFAHLVITNVAAIQTCGQSVVLELFFYWEIYFTPEQTFLHQNVYTQSL